MGAARLTDRPPPRHLRHGHPGPVEALDTLGFKTRSGSLDALVQWASLFDFEDSGEDREAAWGKLMAAHRADPLVRIPEELIMVGRVLIVQTGLIARIRPSWRMDDLVEARLAST